MQKQSQVRSTSSMENQLLRSHLTTRVLRRNSDRIFTGPIQWGRKEDLLLGKQLLRQGKILGTRQPKCRSSQRE